MSRTSLLLPKRSSEVPSTKGPTALLYPGAPPQSADGRSNAGSTGRRDEQEGKAKAKRMSSKPGAGGAPPDAIIIGSGFGGSVSAARLAEQGLRVLVLERGPWWGESELTPSRPYPRGAWGFRKILRGLRWDRGARGRNFLLNRDGLLELHVFDRFVALTASGVGGGSLVYSDLMVEPDATFFKYFPAEISAEEMAPFYERVRQTLHPSPLPDRPPRTAVFERAVRSAGMPAARYPDLAVAWPSADDMNRKASSSIFGCEYPGKRSMDRTYVPLALSHGADVRSLCEVVVIERLRRGYRVRWLDHQARTNAHADAQVVVLAAGTFGSLRLLYSARQAHALEMPPALGRHFSLGGDMMASVAGFPGAGESEFGPCVGAAVFVERHGEHRFLICEGGSSVDALPIPAPLRLRMSKSVGLAAMGRDASTGTMGFDGRELRTNAGRSMDPDLYAEVQHAMSSIVDGYDARDVSINPPGGAKSNLVMTVHPMGGASIGETEHEGVVDHAGQVFGNPGLYVADASTFPHAPGIPPSMTIAALAERQAVLIAQRTAAVSHRVSGEREPSLSGVTAGTTSPAGRTFYDG